MNSQTQTHVPNTFSTSSQSLFKQTALARNYSSQNAVSKPGVSFLTPRGRRQLQHRKTGRNERPETKQTRRTELSPPLELKNFQPILMSKIFKAAEESGRLFTQSPARVVMRSQPVVFASGVVLRRENLRIEAFLNHGKTGRFERLETLTHQLVHSRQRVESREGYAKIPAGPLSVSSEAGLRQMLAPNDSRPQFLRQPRIIQESTPSRADLRPMPPLTVNQLTDKVMQQIDRRLVIWRERTGRV